MDSQSSLATEPLLACHALHSTSLLPHWLGSFHSAFAFFPVRFSPKGPLTQLAPHTILRLAHPAVVDGGLGLPVVLHDRWHTIHPLSDVLHHAILLPRHLVTLGPSGSGPSISCEALLVDESEAASQTRQSLACDDLTCMPRGPATPASAW